MPSPRNSFTYLDAIFLAIIFLLCFCILEFLLRSFVFDPRAAYIRNPGWAMQIRNNGLLPNVYEDHLYQVNKLGIRGELPKFGSKPKIAVFGGSTVEDWVLKDSKTWPQQLATQLADCEPDIWVANLGKAGVNARHHLIQLPEIQKYMPRFDMFVVLLGLNDFLYDLNIHHPIITPEDWWRRQALMYDHSDEGSLAITAISKRLYQQFVTNKKGGIPTSDFGHYQKYLRDAYAKVTNEQWITSMPDLTSHISTYRKTISDLKAYADAYGAHIVFVTQPYVWSRDMTNETKAQIYAGFIGSDIGSPKTKWYTTTALESGLSAYNDALIDKCQTDRLACVDAAGKLPKSAEFFFDDFHFSERGAREIGRIVADGVRPQISTCH
jgi:lysophospholipase L1-like esterase